MGLNVPRQVALHNDLWEIRGSASSFGDVARVNRALALDWMLSRALPSTYVAVSREQARGLRAHGRRTQLITNGLPAKWPALDDLDRQAARRCLKLRPEEFVVGYIGRYEKQKGVDRLWEAARIFPPGWRLLVAGEGSIPPPNIAAITDLGWQDDPSDAIASFDVAVMPSRWEVFGRAAIEILSFGCPLLHSGVGGLAEISAAGDPLCTEMIDWSPNSVLTHLRRLWAEPSPNEVARQTALRIRTLYPSNERAWYRGLSSLMRNPAVAR
jgi:glycosyltransferase involved in cell wall biosynthesis